MSTTVSAPTLPGLLLARAAAMPGTTALRYHHLGIWEQETWASLAETTRTVGNGLASLGIKQGDVVGLVASNQPSWVVADLAIQGLGAITLAIDPGFSPGTVVTLLQTQGATAVIVGDQEQYDKVAESRHLVPRLSTIVVMNTRGIRHLDRTAPDAAGDGITTWSRVLAAGATATDVWTASVSALDPDKPVTVEGHVERAENLPPRLRAHSASSRDLLAACDDLAERLGAHAGDELHPVTSFADPVERTVSETLALRVGAVMNIGEGGELMALEARSVQPSIAHLPAAQLRQIRSQVVARSARRGPRKFAVDRVLKGSSTVSRSATRDLRITKGALVLFAVLAVVIHRTLLDVSGWIRLGLIGALGILFAAVLLGGGFAVRPYIRKHFGLAEAHSLLTSPDIDAETSRFLSALHLSPILERRGSVAPEAGANA